MLFTVGLITVLFPKLKPEPVSSLSPIVLYSIALTHHANRSCSATVQRYLPARPLLMGLLH